MIRKYNYTGRQKISQERILIKQDSAGDVISFEANLKIHDLGLPDYAKVYIEPYFKSSFMRFDFGNVARIQSPVNTQLIDIPITERVLYRLKIVDESNEKGLILGFADEIIAKSNINDGNKSPLLPVDFNELNNRIWKLDFRNEGPVLCVNWHGRIDKIGEIVLKDKKFFSLVYPEVIRQIAFTIASDEDFDFNDSGNSWQYKWIKYFKASLGIMHIPISKEGKDVVEWSDEVSDSFCKKSKVIDLLTN